MRVQAPVIHPPAGLPPDAIPGTVAARDRFDIEFLGACLKKGGAGDSPVSVGDPSAERRLAPGAKPAWEMVWSVLPLPSGESPDGRGW